MKFNITNENKNSHNRVDCRDVISAIHEYNAIKVFGSQEDLAVCSDKIRELMKCEIEGSEEGLAEMWAAFLKWLGDVWDGFLRLFGMSSNKVSSSVSDIHADTAKIKEQLKKVSTKPIDDFKKKNDEHFADLEAKRKKIIQEWVDFVPKRGVIDLGHFKRIFPCLSNVTNSLMTDIDNARRTIYQGFNISSLRPGFLADVGKAKDIKSKLNDSTIEELKKEISEVSKKRAEELASKTGAILGSTDLSLEKESHFYTKIDTWYSTVKSIYAKNEGKTYLQLNWTAENVQSKTSEFNAIDAQCGEILRTITRVNREIDVCAKEAKTFSRNAKDLCKDDNEDSKTIANAARNCELIWTGVADVYKSYTEFITDAVKEYRRQLASYLTDLTNYTNKLNGLYS